MASLSDRDRLLGNDPGLIHLDLSLEADSNIRHSAVALTAAAITNNSNVTNVRVTVHESFVAKQWQQSLNTPSSLILKDKSSPSSSDDDREETESRQQTTIRDFFRAIGNLPKLESLSFYPGSFRPPRPQLPTALLTETLQKSRAINKQLKRLRIHGLVLHLEEWTWHQDMCDLEKALHRHPTLVEVSMDACMFSGHDTMSVAADTESQHNKNPCDRLFSAFATIPNLEYMEIRHARNSRKFLARAVNNNNNNIGTTNLPANVLANFAQCPRLRQLQVFHFNLGSDHLELLSARIHEFHQLQELSLSLPTIDAKACQALGNIVRHGECLQSLTTTVEGSHPRHLDQKSTNCIASALAGHNDTTNTTNHQTNNNNSKRKRIQLQSLTLEGVVVHDLKPFVEALRSNCTLETLDIKSFPRNTWHDIEIQTLLRLNQIGRYRLLHDDDDDPNRGVPNRSNNSKSQWVDAVIQVTDDLQCIFYLLSANPSLCATDRGR